MYMGFDLDRVVSAYGYVGIDPSDGEEYELEEDYKLSGNRERFA